MISTKGRYALRVMIDMASQSDSAYIPLNVIAERQAISEKYLEAIMSKLVKAKLVKSLRGKTGGYKLTKAPQDYTVYEILIASEGSLAPVGCLAQEELVCDRGAFCPTLPIWQGLDELTQNYLQGLTLASVCAQIQDAGPCPNPTGL